MNVACPACNKQHRVSDQMAGKRAKCGCGEVMTIPAAPVPEPTADDWLGESFDSSTASPLPGASHANTGSVLFECRYGMLRPYMWWLLGVNVITALFLIPAGIFWNKGWVINHVPLSPWAAMLLFECVGFGLLLTIAYLVSGHFLHRKKPQRIAVTEAGVILPKGKLSTDELFIPGAQVQVKHWPGPVENLDFKRGTMRTHRLVSIQFPTDEDYETFFEYLRERDKV